MAARPLTARPVRSRFSRSGAQPGAQAAPPCRAPGKIAGFCDRARRGHSSGGVPRGATARALVEPGRQYALYINGGTHADLELELPAGRYSGSWVDPKTGGEMKSFRLRHDGGRASLESPEYREDVALRVVARAE